MENQFLNFESSIPGEYEFKIPEKIKSIKATIIAGGGAGGGGWNTSNCNQTAGGGGGAGQKREFYMDLDYQPPVKVNLKVGYGGKGIYGRGEDGQDSSLILFDGNSEIIITIISKGGKGGGAYGLGQKGASGDGKPIHDGNDGMIYLEYMNFIKTNGNKPYLGDKGSGGGYKDLPRALGGWNCGGESGNLPGHGGGGGTSAIGQNGANGLIKIQLLKDLN